LKVEKYNSRNVHLYIDKEKTGVAIYHVWEKKIASRLTVGQSLPFKLSTTSA